MARKIKHISATENLTTAPPELPQDGHGSFSLFSEFDIHLFKAGKHYHLYNKLGSHQVRHQGKTGVYFAVWAPNAEYVSVIGNFNGWHREIYPMNARWDGSGIWEIFIPNLTRGEYYKYFIRSRSGYTVEKGDPYAVHWENPPNTASIVWDLDFKWTDKNWLKEREKQYPLHKPVSIYEIHLGSWKRVADEGRFMSHRENI